MPSKKDIRNAIIRCTCDISPNGHCDQCSISSTKDTTTCLAIKTREYVRNLEISNFIKANINIYKTNNWTEFLRVIKEERWAK